MTILLFDAGGVLIELGPPPIKTQWLPPDQTLDDVWSNWISMDAGRKFESGQISAVEFAQEMISTLELKTDTESFIEHFRAWPVAPFAGTREWLLDISNSFHTAMLSNTNELHWRRMKDEMGLGDVLNDYFLSHKMGLVKPDREIFDKVVSLLNTSPAEIVFFDDNQKNIDAAKAVGMRAVLTQGAEQLRKAVQDLS